MEKITSRKNQHIQYFRALCSDKSFRRETGFFVCDGEKLLREAVSNNAQIGEILLREDRILSEIPSVPSYCVDAGLFEYVSPLENSPGPLFTVKIKNAFPDSTPKHVMILENVQDPGNVGTVLRTAAALKTDLVILCGDCADVWHPKTVRATMGALFHQNIWQTDIQTAIEKCREWNLPIYAAALTEQAEDIRDFDLRNCAVAVGNEGKGLSAGFLSLCDAELIIPMQPESESLNAAIAAAIIMWEMDR